jgi:hypothetical protein
MKIYLFIDESGDPGNSIVSSHWFVLTAALVTNKSSLAKIVKEVWNPLKARHKKLGELHAYHATPVVRKRMLRKLAGLADLRVICIACDKRVLPFDSGYAKGGLYIRAAEMLLDRVRVVSSPSGSLDFEAYIDRRDTSKVVRERFVARLALSIGNGQNPQFAITFHNSHENRALQAVDFISWAIFRKYEWEDNEYYDLIKRKILDESIL